MKKEKLILCFISFVILTIISTSFLSTKLLGSTYIEINRINHIKTFPEIEIILTIKNLNPSTLTNLDESNIYIYEDGYRVGYYKLTQKVTEKGNNYTVFSIDSSKSISKQFQKKIKLTASNIIKITGSRDKYLILKFNDSVKQLTNFDTEKDITIHRINNIDRHGTKTLLFNSIYEAISLLDKKNVIKKSILVFTDGKDEGSTAETDDIINFAKKSGISIHFITNGHLTNRETIQKISGLTGGKLYSNSKYHYKTIYDEIQAYSKNRYKLNYHSRINTDGSLHTIEVRFKHKNIKDRDSQNITLNRSFINLYYTSSKWHILLLSLLSIILIIVSYICIHILKGNKILHRENNIEDDKSNIKQQNIEEMIKLDTIEQYHKDHVLLTQDPEFSYSDAWLVEMDGPELGKKFPMYWDESSIGRGDDNSIIVNDDSVSLKHAKIKNIKNGYYLFDLTSDNGTFLNDKKLLRPKSLYDWDVIRVGRTKLIFRGSNSSKQ